MAAQRKAWLSVKCMVFLHEFGRIETARLSNRADPRLTMKNGKIIFNLV